MLGCYPTLNSFKFKRFDLNFNLLSFSNGEECSIPFNNKCGDNGIDYSVIYYVWFEDYNLKYYEITLSCKGIGGQEYLSINDVCNHNFDYVINYNDTIICEVQEQEEEEEKEEKEENEEEEEKVEKEEENIEESENKYFIIFKNNTKDNPVIKGTIKISNEDIDKQFDNIIKDVELNKNYQLIGKDYEMVITKINTYSENQTNIDFSECEKILRNKYSLSDEEILTIIQLEINKKNNKALTWQLEYAIYDSEKERLDLSYCENINLKINYTIKNSSYLDTEKISKFSDLGIDIFNIKDDFFNDICYSYGESNSDLTLKDRKNEIFQNYSVCDNNCEYEQVDLETMTIECNCKIKSNITLEVETISFVDAISTTFKESNIGVIKCYKLVFNFSNKINNIGFWVMLILIILHIPCIIIYFIFNEKPIKNFVFNEMKKNQYIINNNNPTKSRKMSKNQANINVSVINNNVGNSPKPFINKIKKITPKKNNKFSQNRNSKLSFQKKVKNCNSKNSKIGISASTTKLKSNAKNCKYSIIRPSINIFNSNTKKHFEKKNNYDNKIKNKKIVNIYMDDKKRKISKKLTMKEGKISENKYYTLIHIDANNSKKHKLIVTDYFLNVYTYLEAIKHDMRSFWRILYISLLYSENLMNAFILKSPLEIRSLRICLLIFIYSCNLALNTLFYSTSKISDKHNYDGDSLVIYTFVNNITIVVFSTLISFILVLFFKILINSRYDIEDIFRQEEKKMRKNKKYTVNEKNKKKIKEKISAIIFKLKIKNIIFICIEFLFMLFFFYFVTAFCDVYSYTQLSWLEDSVSSFFLSLILEFCESLYISLLYKVSITYKIECMFNLILFINKII